MKKLGRQFAISDIHGCVKTFQTLLLDVLKLSKEDKLYLLGDYINKGPDSKGVLDFIFQLRREGFDLYCLRGNHEQYLLDGMKYSWEEIAFLSRGGFETLNSFDAKTINDIPVEYIEFIGSLPYYVELENYLLIHAGLNFDLDDPFKDDFSMLNIRKMDVDLSKTGNKQIIHGHVPTAYQEIEKLLNFSNNHISIDSGCVYHHIHALNHLVALDIRSRKLYIQKNID